MSNTRTAATSSSNGAPKPRATRPRTDKPAGVAMNLDTLEREDPAVEPFVVVIDGKRRVFADPFELDWQELLMGMRDPLLLFSLTLSADDCAEVMAQKIPTWKYNALSRGYLAHYGITMDALGNPSASRT